MRLTWYGMLDDPTSVLNDVHEQEVEDVVGRIAEERILEFVGAVVGFELLHLQSRYLTFKYDSTRLKE